MDTNSQKRHKKPRKYGIGVNIKSLISLDIKSITYQVMDHFIYKISNKDEKGA